MPDTSTKWKGRNNMNIKEYTKKDGTKVYRTNVYLGVDSLTGKQVRTSVTAKSRKMCETKAHQAINNFINNGSTIARKKVVFDNFNSLALSWFESYKLTVIYVTIYFLLLVHISSLNNASVISGTCQ